MSTNDSWELWQHGAKIKPNAMKRLMYQSQRTVSFLDQQDGANDQQEVLQDQGKHQFKY
jgi:hypothetical protein